ncbi:hypothetical protein ADIARSV_1950 [Arcticibacter svalbardensis MN12-7]|uniref:Uncharacterized protein n=1 Tax=Arcticibacter svalbardensis MN12-7 TaxID=1150600 RepID=R9GTG8_9SPHI|nr:hypothetical protein ADIARSV_1950 [Arcticibacter svalbardensis MN12-7]
MGCPVSFDILTFSPSGLSYKPYYDLQPIADCHARQTKKPGKAFQKLYRVFLL